MNSNANLIEQLSIAEKLNNGEYATAAAQIKDIRRLAELVGALHLWIYQGGPLPMAWRQLTTDNYERMD